MPYEQFEKAMMTQISLSFDPPRARRSDPSTSHRAAAKVNAVSIRQRILDALEVTWVLEHDGLTTFELAEKFALGRDAISPHMKPLEKMGKARRADFERLNPATNCNCTVWLISKEELKA